jgi:hypothetical protein
MSDEIADRTQAQRRQFSGDVEQPFTERGSGTRTPADRATRDPEGDQDAGPVAEAVARRQDAEQRFDRRGDGRRDGDATAARLGLGTVGTLGLAGELFGGDSEQPGGLLDRPQFDVGTGADTDATPDIDVFTDFDFGQDIGGDTDTRGDTDTDTGQDTPVDIPTTDLTDPPETDRPRDPGRDTPNDPPSDPPRDPPTDVPFEEEDENDDDGFLLFGTRSRDDTVDSGLQSGADAFEDLFGGR